MLVIAVDIEIYDTPHHPQEFEDLLHAAEYHSVEYVHFKVRDPHPQQYINQRQLDELLYTLEEHTDVKKVIFNCKLIPRQTFALEKALENTIIDKPMLILEIFERRANSKDIKMQVQLAQLKYSVPRMVTKMGEAVRSERPGYMGTGEQATDILISDMNRRIKTLERKLEKQKELLQVNPDETVPKIPIIGYYSSGKSTLFNILTDSDREVGSEAFTTMILKTARSPIAGYPIELIDTVGLVELPDDIIGAFDLMLTSIFTFNLVILCLDCSIVFDYWKQQLADYKEYVARFTEEHELKMIIILTKTDLCTKSEVQLRVDHIADTLKSNSYEVMTSRSDHPEKVQQDFVQCFERVFASELTEFYFPSLSPSQASKLHEIARVEQQTWNDDGTTGMAGKVPVSLFNRHRGEFS